MRLKAFCLRPSSVVSIPSTASTFQFYSALMACQRHSVVRTNRPVASSVLFSTRTDGVRPSPTAKNSRNLGSQRRPLWIDTDVGFDDLVAIGCCHGAVRNKSSACDDNATAELSIMAGISTVGGGLTSDPSDGVAILRGLLPVASEGLGSMPIVAGRGRQTTRATDSGQENLSMQSNNDDPSWLAKCREQMNEFCGSEGILLLPSSKNDDGNDTSSKQQQQHSDDDEATAAVRSTTFEASRNDIANTRDKMDLVCLGPLTNLAHWLDEVPDFATERLNSIWILGGNLPIRRRLSSPSTSDSIYDDDSNNCEEASVEAVVEAEFNFARDPEAVRTVFHHAGLHNATITIHVVPQEVCDRRAFEESFQHQERHLHRHSPQEERTRRATQTTEESHPRIRSAANVIEDWLQSSPSRSQSQEESQEEVSEPQSPPNIQNTTGGVDTVNVGAAVSSLLPAWMVRLIRTRTFSVYGDPICIYVRDHTGDSDSHCDSNSAKRNDSRRRPRILWKDYFTSGSSPTKKNEILTVDSDGRLILQVNADGTAEANPIGMAELSSPTIRTNKGCTTQHDDETPGGITVRVAHEVELGPVYMDWLTRSLLFSSRRN